MTFLDMNEFETERLILRRITKNDASDMYEYAKRGDVTRFLTWHPHEDIHYTRGYIKFLQKKYRSGEYHDWGIELKENGKFIGTCGYSVFDPDNHKAEIGYVLNPDYHNLGFATEVVKAVIEYSFLSLGLHRLEARTVEENTASQRVLEKCGFLLEGTFTHDIFLKGEYKNIKHYALINKK